MNEKFYTVFIFSTNSYTGIRFSHADIEMKYLSKYNGFISLIKGIDWNNIAL